MIALIDKYRGLLLLAAAAIFGVGAFYLSFRSLVENKSDFVLSTGGMVVDLGSGFPGEVLTGSVELRNATRSEQVIQITRSCGCLKVQRDTVVIPGNTSRPVDFSIALSEPGQTRLSELRFTRAGVDETGYVQTIKSECLQPAVASPDIVDFGHVTNGSGTVREIELVPNFKDAGVAITCTSHGNCLRVEPVPNSATRFAVHFQPRDLAGRFDDNIQVKVEARGTTYEMSVPVRATISGAFLVTPKFVSFPATVSSDLPVQKTVLLQSPDGTAPGPLVSSNCPSFLSVSDLGVAGMRYRRIAISLTAAATMTDCTINLSLSGSDSTPVIKAHFVDVIHSHSP